MNQAPIGNESVRTFILRALEQHQTHAFLLQGPKGVGKRSMVEWVAQSRFCNSRTQGQPCGVCQACAQVKSHTHQDLWWVERGADSQKISIDQIREIKNFAQLSSFQAQDRMVVIDGVGDLTEEAANSLLKVLEEPSVGVVFFLIDHQQQPIPVTIRSRCVVLHCGLVTDSAIVEWLEQQGVAKELAEMLARQAGGKPGIAYGFAKDDQVLARRYEIADRFLTLWQAGGWAALQLWFNAELGGSKSNTPASENRELATFWLMIWLELARDMLLTKAGLPHMVRYQKLQTKLELLTQHKDVRTLVDMCKKLEAAVAAVAANAQVRLTLESLALSLTQL